MQNKSTGQHTPLWGTSWSFLLIASSVFFFFTTDKRKLYLQESSGMPRLTASRDLLYASQTQIAKRKPHTEERKKGTLDWLTERGRNTKAVLCFCSDVRQGRAFWRNKHTQTNRWQGKTLMDLRLLCCRQGGSLHLLNERNSLHACTFPIPTLDAGNRVVINTV